MPQLKLLDCPKKLIEVSADVAKAPHSAELSRTLLGYKETIPGIMDELGKMTRKDEGQLDPSVEDEQSGLDYAQAALKPVLDDIKESQRRLNTQLMICQNWVPRDPSTKFQCTCR